MNLDTITNSSLSVVWTAREEEWSDVLAIWTTEGK
jgi:hypothetical protein